MRNSLSTFGGSDGEAIKIYAKFIRSASAAHRNIKRKREIVFFSCWGKNGQRFLRTALQLNPLLWEKRAMNFHLATSLRFYWVFSLLASNGL